MKKLALAIAVLFMSGVGAIAADLPARNFTKAPAIVSPVTDWTGFYVGVNAGGAWGRSDPTTTTVYSPNGYFATTSIPAIAAAGLQSTRPSGFTGGLEAGYNWQVSNVVLGIEGDFDSFHIKGNSAGAGIFPCCAPSGFSVTSSVGSDWLATVRGRVGVTTDNLLFFATGGVAVTNLKGSFAYTDNCFVVPACGGAPGGPLTTEALSFSNTKAGYAIGGGIEAALWRNWSVKAEYLYVNFGAISGTGLISAPAGAILFGSNNNPFTHSFGLSANLVRLGVNYRFGGPVVAKY